MERTEGARMEVKGSGGPPKNAPKFEPIVDEDDDEIVDTAEPDEEAEERPRKRRRRRGRRGTAAEIVTTKARSKQVTATKPPINSPTKDSKTETAEQGSDDGEKPKIATLQRWTQPEVG